MQFYSHIRDGLSFYKHSWKIWSYKSSRKNNYDYHKMNQKYQKIYSFFHYEVAALSFSNDRLAIQQLLR